MVTVLLGLLALVFVAGMIILSRSVYLIQQAEMVIIERFGKYYRTLHPGLHMIVPFIDIPRTATWTFLKEVEGRRYYRYYKTFSRIDLRETVYDFPKQNVITRDNVAIEINALLYYQITDPKAAIYEVSNLSEAIEKLTHSTLRNVIGSMDLDESLISRDQINGKLRMILDEATDKWGVKINRVELQEINPPADIRGAMEKQMRAERERRAVILEAEGAKRAAILGAEGDQESKILEARGAAESQVIRAEAEASARMTIAQAEAQALELIKQALPGQDPTQYLIALQYIKTLPQMTEGKDNKLILMPYEASSMVNLLAPLKEILNK
jgi:regulator of protease activity HflC (stomatin/prohibitin superfamily)